MRGREYLTIQEVDRLRRAVRSVGRHPDRDEALILLGFRHGFRVSELVDVRWDQVDLERKTVYCRRLKGSKNGTHDLGRAEVTLLRRLAKAGGGRSAWVFSNERGGMLSRWAVDKILRRAGARCEPPIVVHPHMLRHAIGFHLINEGHSTRRVQDHLGHRQIQHTERYTELAPTGGRRLFEE